MTESSFAAEPTGTAVCVEYLGYTNKPIFPIVISDRRDAARLCTRDAYNRTEISPTWSNYLDQSQMATLLRELNDLPNRPIDANKVSDSFAVVIFGRGQKKAFMLDRLMTVQLLGSLRKYCKGDGRFCRQLDSTRRRAAAFENNASLTKR